MQAESRAAVARHLVPFSPTAPRGPPRPACLSSASSLLLRVRRPVSPFCLQFAVDGPGFLCGF